MEFVIITGRSGSGKTSCLHLLEDLGYYCIDNLPISLLPSLPAHLDNKQKIAIGVDVRNLPEEPHVLNEILQQFKQKNFQLEDIFLETDTPVLLERFSATRRKHPLSSSNTSLNEALDLEMALLEPLQQLADHHIDSSHLNIHQLQQLLRTIKGDNQRQLTVLIQSFGFKHGSPTNSDFVFDVRCLPNPYWVKELRPLTGQDKEIIDFFNDSTPAQTMADDITQFIGKWLPKFYDDNRNYLTVSIGCTGGRHRSVYLTDCIYQHFKQLELLGMDIQVRHRDME